MKKTLEERLDSGFVRTKAFWTPEQSPVTVPTVLVTISADSGLKKNPCGEVDAEKPILADIVTLDISSEHIKDLFALSNALRTGYNLGEALQKTVNLSQERLHEERLHLLQVLNKRAKRLAIEEDKKHREQESLAEIMRMRLLSSLW